MENGKSHRQRSLVGCSPWGRWESNTTERLHFPFSLSCIGEGNGTPPQCSCLENPRDGGAWWAAVYGVAQSRTRLKWLSSRSSSRLKKRMKKYEQSLRDLPDTIKDSNIRIIGIPKREKGTRAYLKEIKTIAVQYPWWLLLLISC